MTVTDAPKTTGRNPLRQAMLPLLVDVALPVGSYYVLSKGLGLSELMSLALSSVIPAVRTVWGIVAQRRINPLALLILTANVAGLLLSLVSGDPRLMLAKESGVSSVIGLAILVSAFAGRPIMSTVLRPIFARGDAARFALWDRLSATSVEFRHAERNYSIVWGCVLLLECAARLIGVYTLSVDTMVWLGPVILIAAILLAFRIGAAAGIRSMRKIFLAAAVR
ncbi:VC0807 family protein [Amycolatopsis sp. GM8]|uniref:VC0807 family protein n=1 Tax=Amycolatopsis sp. GM8 TaxID=2896530 RepID=UPI001F2C6511|nr:VC0807 family protein [Amycolatopsis sp. GM8]